MNAQAKRTARAPEAINVVEFAQYLVANRRAALDLPVDQIRELAAAVLILDQQVYDANRRIAAMMLADPPLPEPTPRRKPDIVRVPIFAGEDAALGAALETLLSARQRLERERHSTGENLARQNFEKAAIAVCNHVTPKGRT
ncbi:hypothetical protein ABWH89_11040 [Hoeflea alexandrii]|uniref:hypothetical protein n=1 Tax=Hoeflea alexandrii TaxID=288436 RepID=UPI0035D126AA